MLPRLPDDFDWNSDDGDYRLDIHPFTGEKCLHYVVHEGVEILCFAFFRESGKIVTYSESEIFSDTWHRCVGPPKEAVIAELAKWRLGNATSRQKT